MGRGGVIRPPSATGRAPPASPRAASGLFSTALRLLCVVIACVTVSVIITAPLLHRPAPRSPPLCPQSPFSVDSILPVFRQPPRRPQPRSRLLPLVLPTPLCPCPRSPFRPPLSIPPRHLSARPALGLPPLQCRTQIPTRADAAPKLAIDHNKHGVQTPTNHPTAVGPQGNTSLTPRLRLLRQPA